MASIGCKFVGQALDGLVIGIEGFDFIQQLLLQAGHFGGVNAVFARQGINGVQALFELLQARRVGIEVVEEAVQFADGFFYLNLRAGNQVGSLAEGARCIVHGGEAVEADGQGAEYVARVVFAAMVDDLPANAEQRFGIGQVFVFLFQLLQFVFAKAEVFQFFELIAEQLVAGTLLVARVG
ncbi:hypothetical protein D9M71_225460 [compost metagenome]